MTQSYNKISGETPLESYYAQAIKKIEEQADAAGAGSPPATCVNTFDEIIHSNTSAPEYVAGVDAQIVSFVLSLAAPFMFNSLQRSLFSEYKVPAVEQKTD